MNPPKGIDPASWASSTFRKVWWDGYFLGVKESILLRIGAKKLGEPDATTAAAIRAITDLDRFDTLLILLGDEDIRTWDDLLGWLPSDRRGAAG